MSERRATSGPEAGWRRLDAALYEGPLVLARVHDLDIDERRRRAEEGARLTTFVECWALIDTGATHSAVDPEKIASPMELRAYDRRRMVLPDRGVADLTVHEVSVVFPDFGIPRRTVRVSSMRLPGPFFMLVGMDLLEGTRLELDVRGRERWIRWTPALRRG